VWLSGCHQPTILIAGSSAGRPESQAARTAAPVHADALVAPASGKIDSAAEHLTVAVAEVGAGKMAIAEPRAEPRAKPRAETGAKPSGATAHTASTASGLQPVVVEKGAWNIEKIPVPHDVQQLGRVVMTSQRGLFTSFEFRARNRPFAKNSVRPYVWRNGRWFPAAREFDRYIARPVATLANGDVVLTVKGPHSRSGSYILPAKGGDARRVARGKQLVITGASSRGGYTGYTGPASKRVAVRVVNGKVYPLLVKPAAEPADINNAGDIVGACRNKWGEERAFLIRRGKFYNLGGLGAGGSSAVAVNNQGVVAGHAEDEQKIEHAVIWRDEKTGAQSLTPASYHSSRVLGIADSGAILLAVKKSSKVTHLLLKDGKLIDVLKSLPENIDPQMLSAVAMNKNGRIVATLNKQGRKILCVVSATKAPEDASAPPEDRRKLARAG